MSSDASVEVHFATYVPEQQWNMFEPMFEITDSPTSSPCWS